jgi:hypothetical protein
MKVVPAYLMNVIPAYLMKVVPAYLMNVIPAYLMKVIPAYLMKVVPAYLMKVIPAYVTYDRSVSFFGFDLTDIMTEILLKVTLNTNKTDHHDITDIRNDTNVPTMNIKEARKCFTLF